MLSSLGEFDTFALASVLFLLAAIAIYTGNATGGGDNLFFGSLGLLIGIPVLAFKAIVGSSLGFLSPVLALVVLLYLVKLREVVGEAVYVCILGGWMLISLGV